MEVESSANLLIQDAKHSVEYSRISKQCDTYLECTYKEEYNLSFSAQRLFNQLNNTYLEDLIQVKDIYFIISIL